MIPRRRLRRPTWWRSFHDRLLCPLPSQVKRRSSAVSLCFAGDTLVVCGGAGVGFVGTGVGCFGAMVDHASGMAVGNVGSTVAGSADGAAQWLMPSPLFGGVVGAAPSVPCQYCGQGAPAVTGSPEEPGCPSQMQSVGTALHSQMQLPAVLRVASSSSLAPRPFGWRRGGLLDLCTSPWGR